MNTFVKNNSLLISKKEDYIYNPENLVFVFDTNLESISKTVSVPIGGFSPNVTVNWGDGTSDSYNTPGFKTHTYASHGEYVVQISGFMTALSFFSGNPTGENKKKLKRCLSFGNIGINSLYYGFYYCVNLIQVPKVLSSSNSITNLNNCFAGCSSIDDPNIGLWNTSEVTDLGSLFYGANIFNKSLNSWNTSKVTNIGGAFRQCPLYNQPMNNWNTSNVTNMGTVFFGAPNFNGDISSWNTSKVTSMGYMFYYANNFNQNISSWDTSKVTNMTQMFGNAINFNQNLALWNVGLVTDMSFMFDNADSFSSNLSNWNLSSLSSSTAAFGFMRFATGLNSSDYDATLIGWNNNKASFRNDINITFGSSKYTSAAASARAALISYGWTIADGGML
jgi:surface protein